MEKKNPQTVRVPEDIEPAWRTQMKELKPEVRDNTYGNTQGTAVTLFMGLPADIQTALIRSFLVRPERMRPDQVSLFGHTLVDLLSEKIAHPNGISSGSAVTG